MEKIGNFLAGWVTQHRTLSIVISIVVALSAAAGGKNLGFTNDYRVFFSGDDPHLLAFESLQDTYSKNDNALIALAPDDGVVFKPATLAAIADITERAWQTPYSVRVDSLSNYQHTQAEGDDLLVGDLYEGAGSMDGAQIQRVRDIALNEPLLVHRLIAADGRTAAVNITVELPGIDEGAEGPEVVAYIRELRDYIRQTYPDLKPYLSGIVMMNNAFPEASLWDMTHLIPAAFGVILLLVFLQLRGLGGTLGTCLTILLSIVSAMGLAGWMGIKLSPPAMSAPTIILTLAVADCVHILANWMHKVREGEHRKSAMKESLRINFSPVFLTSVTTAIGFLSLNFSDAPPFRDLGNISAMGVMFAWFYAVFFLPALVSVLPVKPKAETSFGTTMMNRFAEWVIASRRVILPVMAAIIVLTIALIPKNELNDVFVEYFDERVEFRTDSDFVVENLTGIYFVDFSLDSGESGGISEPAFLSRFFFTN
jgi:predicted RND superfamily exporter protein